MSASEIACEPVKDVSGKIKPKEDKACFHPSSGPKSMFHRPYGEACNAAEPCKYGARAVQALTANDTSMVDGPYKHLTDSELSEPCVHIFSRRCINLYFCLIRAA